MRNPARKLVALVACAAGPVGPVYGVDRLVGNQTELLTALAASAPGDSVVLRNGIWSNLSVNYQSINGAPGNPVRIRAQTPGQTIVAGNNWFFDVGGSNYEVSGLTFKDENANLKSVRFRGTGADVYDNAFLLGGRYHQVIFDALPDSAGTPPRFRNNFAAGKQDRGLILQLDNSFRADVSNNYFGHRPEGGPSGNTNGWETIRIGVSTIMNSSLQADIRDNYFEATNGEAETISDKTRDNRIRDNTFRNVTKGWVTARHGGDGVYERNIFLNSLGIRVGNSDDTIADHPGIVIRGNYIEGPNAKILLPGYQSQATIDRNTVIVTAGAYNNAGYTTGKFGIEYTNTNPGTLTGNISWISDSTYAAVQAGTMGSIGPVATGGGNFAFNAGSGPAFSSSTPTAVRNLFAVANPHFVRDGYGIQRPTAVSDAGAGTLSIPLARQSAVGPSWLDPVMRLNKFMPLELKFNADYTAGVTSPTAHNTGYLVTPATLGTATASLDLHSPGGLGASGRTGDRAFDNRSTAGMGSTTGPAARVAPRDWFGGLEAITLTGWFRTDGTQTLGNGASLIEHASTAGGWSLRANTAGALTLNLNSGTNSGSATSNAVFTATDAWTFFAVTFDARPSSNEVTFYVGSESADVTPAGTRSLGVSVTAASVASDLLIGSGFDGLLDNLRLFSARRQVTYTDDTGSTFTKNGNGQDYAILSLAELRTIRRFDLGILPGDLDESRAIDAADIDLLAANIGNGAFDVDGDFDTDRADLELLIGGILGSGAGDANLDRRVDIADFSILASNFNAPGGWAAGDFTGDAAVTIADFALLAWQFNHNYAAPVAGAARPSHAAVPEPFSSAPAALLAVLLPRRRQSAATSATPVSGAAGSGIARGSAPPPARNAASTGAKVSHNSAHPRVSA